MEVIAVPDRRRFHFGTAKEPGASNVFAVTMIVGVKASPRSGAPVGLSKIEDYLVDNLYVLMLSELKDAVNKKKDVLRDAVPNWESGGGLLAIESRWTARRRELGRVVRRRGVR